MVHVCVTNLVLQRFEPKDASFTCGQGLYNLQILVDHTRSIICCYFCESWWIQADRSRSISSCFSESLRIPADRCRSICRDAAHEVPIPPFPSEVLNLFSITSYILGKGSIVQTISILHGLTLTVTVCTGCQHDFGSVRGVLYCFLSVNVGFVYSTAFKDQKSVDVVRRQLGDLGTKTNQ